jgi:hypothetical protein
MRTIVETDATTVRVEQHPERCKKNIICRWIILIVLICSILILIGYISTRNKYNPKKHKENEYNPEKYKENEYNPEKYKGNEYNPEKSQEQHSIPFKKLIYFIVSNNNGEYQGNSMRHSFTVFVSFIYLRRIHSAVNTSTEREQWHLAFL